MEFQEHWQDMAKTRLSLELDGKLVFGQFENLRSYIFNLKEKPPQHISFDLTNVDLIDSSGLGLLIIADEITGKQHNVTLKSPNTNLQHLFDVCKLSQMMEIQA